ncbi:MAG: gluconate 2-dehydrogenase subunit 3 family protein, partial [Candidatus Eisenbacteria bacterium]
IRSLLILVLPSLCSDEDLLAVVRALDREVGGGADLDLFRSGLSWLDRASLGLHGSRFFVMEHAKQMEVLKICDGTAPIHLVNHHDPRRLARRFFERFRFHAFRCFYSSEKGWASVAYTGPPQRPGHCGPREG